MLRSLVGSEMCIRDRGGPLEQLPPSEVLAATLSSNKYTRRAAAARLRELIQTPGLAAELPEEELDLLVGCLVQIPSLYHDRATRLMLRDLVGAIASKSEHFRCQMTLTLGDESATHDWAALMLLDWCCQLLVATPIPAESCPEHLFGCMVRSINTLFHYKCERQAIGCLGALPHEWLSPLASAGLQAQSATSCCLVQCVIAHMSPTQLSEMRELLLASYTQLFLCAAVTPAPCSWHSFDAVLSTSTPDEMGNVLMPALLRGLKRAPEAVVALDGVFFGVISHDASEYLIPVLEAALCDELFHKDESRRSTALATLAQLVHSCHEPSQLVLGLEKLCGIMDGSGGFKLSYNYQKEGCLTAIALLARESLGTQEAAVSRVCQVASDILANEKDEAVRRSALKAVAKWNLTNGTLTPDAVEFWTAVTSSDKNDSVKAAGFLHLHQFLANHQSPLLLADLTKSLMKLLSNCGKKATERPVAVGALACLVQLLAMPSQSVPDGLAKLCANILGADLWLNSGAAMAKASIQDLILQVQLCEALLSEVGEQWGLSEDWKLNLCTGLVRCMLHKSHQVYKPARTAVSTLSKHSGALLQRALFRVLDAELGKQSAEPESQELAGPMQAAAALCATLDLDNHQLDPETMLLAHHPFMRSTDSVVSIGWRMLRPKLSHELHTICDALGTEACTQMVDHVTQALGSEQPTRVSAAIFSIETLVRGANDLVMNGLMHQVVGCLDLTALKQFSVQELEMYLAPYRETVADESTVGMVTYGNHKLSESDRMYADVSDDTSWEEELRRDLEKKKQLAQQPAVKKAPAKKPPAKKKPKKGQEEINFDKPKKKPPAKKPLSKTTSAQSNKTEDKSNSGPSGAASEGGSADSEGVVGRIGRAIGVIDAGLRAVNAIAVANSELLALALPNSVMPAMVDLFGMYVVSERAYKTVAQIVQHACQPEMARLNELIALSSWRALSRVPYLLSLGEPSVEELLESLVGQLCVVWEGGLGIGELGVVAPVLHHVLTAKPCPIQAHALKVVCASVSECAILPWVSLSQLLVHTMKQQPDINMVNNAGQALVAVCSKLPANLQPAIEAVLEGLVCKDETVRNATLRAIKKMAAPIPQLSHNTALLWFGCADPAPDNQTIAADIWETSGHSLPESYCDQLLPMLSHPEEQVRKQTAGAISRALVVWPQSEQQTLNALMELFLQYMDPIAHDLMAGDITGTESSQEFEMRTATRHGVACALESSAASLTEDSIRSTLTFMMKRALGDEQHQVRQQLTCLLYTSDAADEEDSVDLGGRRIIKKKKKMLSSN
eukprot:TRINITY_DN6019_c0_g1_i3.p1 TRINITY_DN6019_c0_g1~~TRINITY_DN6019_c0_g1_i3.p1  ORF type:complete len:1302 (+),score=267.38 TRINITY_DN6019_c0_g1_i3:138-4043(+)